MAVRRVLANLLCTGQQLDTVEVQTVLAESSTSSLREFIDVLKAAIKDKTKSPTIKTKALRALCLCIENSGVEVLHYASKKVLPRLTKLALAGDDSRGADLFGATDGLERQASIEFFTTLLNGLRTWAQKFPVFAGADSPYKRAFLKVRAKVAFPPDPKEEQEQQKWAQIKRETLHVQHLMETMAPYREVAPLVEELRSKHQEVLKALHVPSKYMRLLLSVNDQLANTLAQFDEVYPRMKSPRAKPVHAPPSRIEPLQEPLPLPPPLVKYAATPCEPSTPHNRQALDKIDELCVVIHDQEALISQLSRELRETQQQLSQCIRERDSLLQSLQPHEAEEPKTMSLRSSVENSFMMPQDGELTSRWFDGIESEPEAPAINLKQAQRCFNLTRGVLYSGEISCTFCWAAPRVLTLTLRPLSPASEVSISSSAVQCMGTTWWQSLSPDQEARCQVQVSPTDLYCLPTIVVTSVSAGRSRNLTLALPVGPVQSVTRSGLSAQESVQEWRELSPFQTIRKFLGLRRELKSMQAVAIAVSFADTFKCYGGAEIPRLGRATLLLCGKAQDKNVLVCVSLNKDASGGAVAVRCAQIRLREALLPCFLAALVA